MNKLQIREQTAFLFALVAFLVAALSLTGVILETDLAGRITWGFIWGLIGVAWITGILKARKNNDKNL